MTSTFTLSSAMQDYLEAILDLSRKGEAVRITDIADKLNITKASVTQAINSLKKLSLVTQDRYGPVELTSKGKELATKVQNRHNALRKFLIEVLKVDPSIAEKDACLMEHVISPHTMDKLEEFLESAVFKEGYALPGTSPDAVSERKEEEQLDPLKTKALSELKTGERGRVIRITAQNPVRRRILEMGITKGTEVAVKGLAPLGDPMELMVRGYNLSLRKEEAAGILVEML